ncbi:MucBP domain-containing protein [Enterococcus sp. AZ189]|uniref:MucBP domain-containing protein n=1 Tax=Enterococcus sp. AZ189 TaxID=2774871 RepID=UPI003F227437
MKKLHISMALALFASQFMLPISSFAESSTPDNQNASETSLSTNEPAPIETTNKYQDESTVDVSSTESFANTTYDWSGISVSLDSDGTLTIFGGSLPPNSITLSQLLGTQKDYVKQIIITDNLTLKGDVSSLFFGLSKLTSIKNSNLIDVSEVTKIDYFFALNTSLTELDLSSWDTSSIISMNNLFAQCHQLTELDLSSWNTSSVVDMGNMFVNMSNLLSLNLTGWDTSSVNNMHGMFMSTPKLSQVDVSHFDTSSATNMSNMFAGTNIISLDLDTWDTSNVTNMNEMFRNSTSLGEINFDNWIVYPNTTMINMFAGTVNLHVLHLGKDFKFNSGAALPEHATTNIFTNKWQNVSTGSINNPAGENIWTSNELMSNYTGDGDTYVWQPKVVTGADVTIYYQDNEGNTIAPDVVRAGNVGDSYTSNQLPINGYKFKEVIGDPTGTFTTEPQSVVYIYERTDAAPVTVKFQDEDGNSLADDVTLNGKVGLPYQSQPASINGWVLKETPANATGTFTAEAQTVVYVYNKKSTTINSSDSGNTPVASKTGTNTYSTGKFLPSTGETTSPLLTIIGAMTLLASGAYVLTLKRKRSN